MSVWTRLFNLSNSPRPKAKTRLGIDSLEAREVPAIVFVGGWGASAYQYATSDPAPAALPSVTDLVLDRFNPHAAHDDVVVDGKIITGQNFDSAAATAGASDYSAVVFVGGWGSSSYHHETGALRNVSAATPTDQFSLNYAKIRFDTATVSDSLTVPEPRPEPIIVGEYLILSAQISGTGDSGRDVLIGGPSVNTTVAADPAPVSGHGNSSLGFEVHCVDHQAQDPTTIADDVVVDGRIITGENFDSAAVASSGYIRIKKLNSGG
ncbi:hypothetical protein [Limnoglobus roseus]|uniref:Uncharacterized protein n=1 Tax=Limnoglobus roseus TaxID=2598579 RepID=A0A5C1AK67_9BACT|nr:hypothetical protein [Limnoglobus roseus]QEL19601.1 hypothetical protein PX52LOC_06677 [Limnoglobus roseus]